MARILWRDQLWELDCLTPGGGLLARIKLLMPCGRTVEGTRDQISVRMGLPCTPGNIANFSTTSNAGFYDPDSMQFRSFDVAFR